MKKKHKVEQIAFVLFAVLFLALPSTYVFANSNMKSTAQFEVIGDSKPDTKPDDGNKTPGTGGEDVTPPTPAEPVDPDNPSDSEDDTHPIFPDSRGENNSYHEEASGPSRGQFAQTGEAKNPLASLIGAELLLLGGMLFILKKKQEDKS